MTKSKMNKPKTTIKLSDIKTPTTVEEFRENLSRFFVKDGGTNNLMVMGIPIEEISSPNSILDDIYTIKVDMTVLMVMGIPNSIPIEEISSLDDIYTITGTGFGGDGSSPSITPTVDFSMDDVKDFMDRTGQVTTCNGFFENEDNFTLYDDQSEFVQNEDNVKFYTLDNQILRGFYTRVLGDFSGYQGREWVGDTRSKYISSLVGKNIT